MTDRYFIGAFQIALKADYPTLADAARAFPDAPAITELPDAWLVHGTEVTEAEHRDFQQAITERARADQDRRCTSNEKCCPDARYDDVIHGITSLTVRCRVCGAIVRHDWD